MPMLVTCSTVAFTPGGWYHLVGYVLYENSMSVVRISAMWSGLLELSDAHEWVVTSKLGNWAAAKAKAGMARRWANRTRLIPTAGGGQAAAEGAGQGGVLLRASLLRVP